MIRYITVYRKGWFDNVRFSSLNNILKDSDVSVKPRFEQLSQQNWRQRKQLLSKSMRQNNKDTEDKSWKVSYKCRE